MNPGPQRRTKDGRVGEVQGHFYFDSGPDAGKRALLLRFPTAGQDPTDEVWFPEEELEIVDV